MKTPPQIFNSKGELLPDIDTSGLDATALALLETVRVEYAATRAAEKVLADAAAELVASERAVVNTTEYRDAHFPPQTFHELFLDTFGGKAAEERNKAKGVSRA